ncbi:hypothetical protein KUCAC02_029377, partial [Chaenocephalus aceratus]
TVRAGADVSTRIRSADGGKSLRAYSLFRLLKACIFFNPDAEKKRSSPSLELSFFLVLDEIFLDNMKVITAMLLVAVVWSQEWKSALSDSIIHI